MVRCFRRYFWDEPQNLVARDTHPQHIMTIFC